VNVEQLLLVVNVESTSEFALAEQVVERDACSNRDTRTELLPSLPTVIQGVDEMLVIG
jgi:hypothetical protein